MHTKLAQIGVLLGVALSLQLANTALGDGVYSWGTNTNGELGAGDTATRYYPAVDASLAAGVTGVSGSWFSGYAIKGGGVVSFGKNDHGQLGDGTTTDRVLPAP